MSPAVKETSQFFNAILLYTVTLILHILIKKTQLTAQYEDESIAYYPRNNNINVGGGGAAAAAAAGASAGAGHQKQDDTNNDKKSELLKYIMEGDDEDDEDEEDVAVSKPIFKNKKGDDDRLHVRRYPTEITQKPHKNGDVTGYDNNYSTNFQSF